MNNGNYDQWKDIFKELAMIAKVSVIAVPVAFGIHHLNTEKITVKFEDIEHLPANRDRSYISDSKIYKTTQGEYKNEWSLGSFKGEEGTKEVEDRLAQCVANGQDVTVKIKGNNILRVDTDCSPKALKPNKL